METIAKFYQPWLEKWRSHRFQAILLICFLLWTPLLVAETLQVQNSCHPMINWSKELPPECQSKQPKQLKEEQPNKPIQESLIEKLKNLQNSIPILREQLLE
jgi:hypothetical protein